MRSMHTRLLAGTVMAIVLSAPSAQAQVRGLTLTNLKGTLHVTQGVPCGGVVEATTSIAGGRMDVTPLLSRSDAIGPVQFHLSRLEMFYTPFSVQHSCHGIEATADFREIGVRLANAVTFRGDPISPTRYRFTIPREQFGISESVLNNLPVPQPERAYRRPSEDVTGEIDLSRGTALLHIALVSRLRFRAGCVGPFCAIDEEHDGRQVTEISAIGYAPTRDVDHDGVVDLYDNCPLVPNPTQSPVATPILTPPPDVTVSSCQSPDIGTATAGDVCHARPVAITNNAPAKFSIGPNLVTWRASDGIAPPVFAQQQVTVAGPDTTAPTLSCTPTAHPRQHRVTAADDCGSRLSLKLGSFSLDNGEVIQIEETGKPGVRFLGTVGNDRIRHFQVGKGQGLVMATDDAGNVARAACGVALDITRQ